MDFKQLSSMRRGAFRFTGKWKEHARALPESGMGYTVARVRLLGGRVFEQVLIDNGELVSRVRGLADVPFKEADIAEIVATHERWDWKEKP